MPIVTISRELARAGTRIAEAAADRLNSMCIDKEVLAEMAQQAGVPVEVIIEAEEKLLARPKVVSEEMRAFFSKQTRKPGAYDEARYVDEMSEAIRAIAAGGNALFVGRGTQLILAGHPQALHVHIYADPAVRAARIQGRRNYASLADAQEMVRRADERRRAWFRRFFTGANWKDPRYYHLMINTGRIGVDLSAEMIVDAAEADAP